MKTTKSRQGGIVEGSGVKPFIPPISSIRGRRVVTDVNAAHLYGADVMTLRKAVEKNISRFPDDFVLRLTGVEVNEHKAFYAFYPEGLAMLAAILDTPLAVNGNVSMMRAFVMLDRLACAGGL